MSTSAKFFSWTMCAAMVATGFAWRARADVLNQQTEVTFSAPVEIPGKVLPAGTYQFKLLNASSTRNIVQIFNKDGTQLYATLLTIPDIRSTPTSKTVMRFNERPSGTPEALRAWFYPGNDTGNEFVYPHSQAAEIAQRTHQNVLEMRDQMKGDIAAPAKTGNEASVQEMRNAEIKVVTPSGDEVDIKTAGKQQ